MKVAHCLLLAFVVVVVCFAVAQGQITAMYSYNSNNCAPPYTTASYSPTGDCINGSCVALPGGGSQLTQCIASVPVQPFPTSRYVNHNNLNCTGTGTLTVDFTLGPAGCTGDAESGYYYYTCTATYICTNPTCSATSCAVHPAPILGCNPDPALDFSQYTTCNDASRWPVNFALFGGLLMVAALVL